MRPTTALFTLTFAPVILLTACATRAVPPQSGLATAADSPRPERRPSMRDPITAAEIARINATSAYDAVAKLRANFLQHRGVSSFMRPVSATRPVVFVDGMEVGTLVELRSIPARDVSEIRFLTSSEATYHYGQGYLAGVIHVTTKR